MSRARLEQVLQDAIAAGILPPDAARPDQDNRPWPVVLLTALGAWLAAIPLLVVVGMLLGDLLSRGTGPYIVGPLVLGGAAVVLRARNVPLFFEQLAVPALLVGFGTLSFGMFRDMPHQTAAGMLALITLCIAAAINRPWLRVLLGVTAATLTMVAFLPKRWSFFHGSELSSLWLALHAVFALWIAVGWIQRNLLNDGARARQAAALESVSVGWLLATLAGLAFWSGMTFLVGASFGGGIGGELARELGPKSAPGWQVMSLQTASLLLALGAAAWMACSWPALRRAWCAGVAAVLVALSWFMPSLGAVLLALAFCVSSGRWRVAAAAGLAGAWIIGAFYYQLSWPLATKAIVLVAAGVALGALTWLAAHMDRRSETTDSASAAPPAIRNGQSGIILGTLAVLIAVNFGIWQKEDLIAHGQPVFVELAPVDPRSLMQGDYMQLNFRVPVNVTRSILHRERPRVVAKRDARGIATFIRTDNGSPLAADEFLLELTPKNGRWILVSDAWFFKEGEAERWEKAKYGEFRVGTNGRALLVGLRGADLERL
ncbi:MAG: hypothetical protein A3I66_14810 [Burkholderiales bacterium RIFCSPLOWO2_02_FULL_57_36]|nr:MAG: hypothetical protein A3I66_14810 [Burkholderiales bacterium RIFCSPLOWO2_02_FULL_57_36]